MKPVFLVLKMISIMFNRSYVKKRISNNKLPLFGTLLYTTQYYCTAYIHIYNTEKPSHGSCKRRFRPLNIYYVL